MGAPLNIILINQSRIRMQQQIASPHSFIDLDVSEQSDSGEGRNLDNREIEELSISYNQMKNFLKQISESSVKVNTEILEAYIERPMKLDLMPKNVMHILDKRIQRMIKNKRLKKNWSSQDIDILCWTFCHYSRLNGISSVEETTTQNWQQISNLIPGSKPDCCMFKILGLKKIKLAKRKWSDYENQLLLQIAKNQEKKIWRVIAQELYKRNDAPSKIFRNAKQCKEHWFCYLNPEIKKGSWKLEEDRKLIQYVYNNNASRKWAQIARTFGGRTQNALKNRYTLIIERLRKQKNITGSTQDLSLLRDYLNKIELNDPNAEIDHSKAQARKLGEKKEDLSIVMDGNLLRNGNGAVDSIEQHGELEGQVAVEVKPIMMLYSYPTHSDLVQPMLWMGQGIYSFPVQYSSEGRNEMFFYCQPNNYNIYE